MHVMTKHINSDLAMLDMLGGCGQSLAKSGLSRNSTPRLHTYN